MEQQRPRLYEVRHGEGEQGLGSFRRVSRRCISIKRAPYQGLRRAPYGRLPGLLFRRRRPSKGPPRRRPATEHDGTERRVRCHGSRRIFPQHRPPACMPLAPAPRFRATGISRTFGDLGRLPATTATPTRAAPGQAQTRSRGRSLPLAVRSCARQILDHGGSSLRILEQINGRAPGWHQTDRDADGFGPQ